MGKPFEPTRQEEEERLGVNIRWPLSRQDRQRRRDEVSEMLRRVREKLTEGPIAPDHQLGEESNG